MLEKWIALAAALALVAVAAPAGAATTDDAKAAPAPAASSAPAASTPPGRAPKTKMAATPNKNLVNLNAASAAQLKALPGGSDQEAARIIAGRPYGSKAFLVTNKVISGARYEEIKALVVAGETTKPAAPKK